MTVTTRTVYLPRHGDTSENAATPGPELERGWSDVPLHPMGRKEERRTAVKLARKGIKAIISSDLKRGEQSGRIVADWNGLELETHSQLRTWNLGEMTGKPQAQADKLKAVLVRSTPDRVPPGGESFSQFKRRVFAALADILAKHSANPIVIMVHGNVDALIRAWKAAGQKPNHAIDADVFLREPEQPGQIEVCQLDPASLKLSHFEAEFEPVLPRYSKHPGSDRCGICKAYGGRNQCTKVRTPMDEDDWCAVGVAKSDGHWFCPIGGK